MKEKEKYEKLKAIIAVCSFVSAVVVGFIALFMPPQGIIDSSVLWWSSQLLIMVATLLGINLNIDYLGKTNKNQDKEQY